ncbi:MAG: serine/threonine protein kinase [Acidobacteriota bacterium]|nr:serine/threonine protein kinase [Acidobacteriota bacterium]
MSGRSTRRRLGLPRYLPPFSRFTESKSSVTMIGQIVSHYRILEKLGAGGMGVVYVAEDTRLRRRVAIKFSSATPDERGFYGRFLREARAISVLSHPHIATVYDYVETADGQPFIVMELINGRNLGEMLRDNALTLQRAVEIVEETAEALAEAHRHGIIHRDIKPTNVMVNNRGTVKVLDFGLAKQLEEERHLDADMEASTIMATHTRSDAVIGTLLYLSPEQATAAPADARSDLFALGAMLYECIAGRPASEFDKKDCRIEIYFDAKNCKKADGSKCDKA